MSFLAFKVYVTLTLSFDFIFPIEYSKYFSLANLDKSIFEFSVLISKLFIISSVKYSLKVTISRFVGIFSYVAPLIFSLIILLKLNILIVYTLPYVGLLVVPYISLLYSLISTSKSFSPVLEL